MFWRVDCEELPWIEESSFMRALARSEFVE
jgi:hypothetical protein